MAYDEGKFNDNQTIVVGPFDTPIGAAQAEIGRVQFFNRVKVKAVKAVIGYNTETGKAGVSSAPLDAFGVRVVTDTCTYLLPAALRSDGVVVTNSAKFAHYGPGNTGRSSALMSLERCVRCAVAGKVVA